jgi:integrase
MIASLVLGYLGLRWAEAVGLQRRNIHLLKRRLHIESTLSEVDGAFVRVAPKTNEERDVVLPVFLADELGAHIGRYVADDPDALVFTTEHGTPIRNSNFRRRHWQPALAAAGIDKLTMHEMRHTSASIMADQGWSLQAVKEQLGHSSILVTADIYSHLYSTSRDELADRLDQLHQAP